MNYNFYAYFDQVELYKRSKTFREDKFFKISQNVKILRSSVIMCSFCAFYMGKYCADASVTEFIDPVFAKTGSINSGTEIFRKKRHKSFPKCQGAQI
jgi:hypothetical protein